MLFGSKESKIEKCIAKKNAGPVIKMVYDKDDKVAMQAIAALGKIGGDDGYNVLIALIREKNAKVRAAAVTALGELGESKAKAHISHMEKTEKDAAVLAAIHEAIGRLHTQD